MATFGNTNVPTLYQGFGGNVGAILMSKFTLTEAGTLSKLSAYVMGHWQNLSYGYLFVAADNAGTPDAMVEGGLTEQFEVAIGETLNLYDADFASPLELAAGDYWLGMQTAVSQNGLGRTAATGSVIRGVTATSTYGTPPSGASFTITMDYTACVYATYATPTPIVTDVEPNSGSVAGGTQVTITGTGFTGATAVHFGSANQPTFTVVSDTSITCNSPAGIG